MPIPALSPAASDLGLGSLLQDQISDETDEQRKKRMEQIQLNQAIGPGQSLAARTIFGDAGY